MKLKHYLKLIFFLVYLNLKQKNNISFVQKISKYTKVPEYESFKELFKFLLRLVKSL